MTPPDLDYTFPPSRQAHRREPASRLTHPPSKLFDDVAVESGNRLAGGKTRWRLQVASKPYTTASARIIRSIVEVAPPSPPTPPSSCATP